MLEIRYISLEIYHPLGVPANCHFARILVREYPVLTSMQTIKCVFYLFVLIFYGKSAGKLKKNLLIVLIYSLGSHSLWATL